MIITRIALAGTVALLAGLPAVASAADKDLLEQAQGVFRPLPKDMATPEYPLTKERVSLGRLLFFDTRFSIDGNLGCVTCHQPALYGTDGRPRSIGVKSRPHPRHAPTVLNAPLQFVIHWRGDRVDAEDQVAQSLLSPITSGQPDEKVMLARVNGIPGYAPLFKEAFPDDPQPVSRKNMALAIGAFERTLVTPSRFDDYLKGKVEALSVGERAGLAKFIEVGCIACHNGPGVGGGMYQKFGVLEDYWKVTGSNPIDKGRAEVTNNEADLYMFKVPSLRNVAMTPPYFHDGSVATLPEAVKVMARVQLGAKLEDKDAGDIVAFLTSLTGPLPADFATSPVLPAGAVPPAQ
ncbi:MAG TPA: cytochrome c peroxidase [Reyranella sp.]|nr:cytochrome c peroxidase [Reyranella sp.]